MNSFKKRDTFLPFSRPTIGQQEIDEVVDCLRTGWLTTGPKVIKLEELFVEYSGGKQEAIALNSATAGLHLALVTLDIKPGDEIITTPITWPSTVNVIEHCGAKPIFADVNKDTLQIDPYSIEERISSRTKAIIPVHFAGAPCDLDPIREIAKQHNISVIEDAAHAVGTRYKGQVIGSESEIAVFSFHPIKNMTTGEGGMILCNNHERAQRLKMLRFHGISRDAWKRYAKGGIPQYEVYEPGFKYNMLDIQAAIGIHQFQKLSYFNHRRYTLAMNYLHLLRNVHEIMPLAEMPYEHTHVWHLFVVRLDIDSLTVSRDEFIMALQELNIGIGLHFPAIHLQHYYKNKYGFKTGDLPNAEWNSQRLFSLPLYPALSEADQEYVVDALKYLIERLKK